MPEKHSVKNGTLYVLKDDKYEEVIHCKISDVQSKICVEDELSHRPDLIPAPQSFEFSGEFDFRSSLVNYIRLFGFRYGINVWLQAKFRKKR